MDDLRLEDIKELLGDKASQFSDEELEENVVKMRFLIEFWLDSFEREIFEGRTLNEVLSGIII